jgi:hypothetical protein
VYYYRICGLAVASDFALPGMVVADGIALADVRVRCGEAPSVLQAAHHAGPTWQLDHHAFLFQVPLVARFLVTGGSEIVVDVCACSTTADAAPFLLGAAFGVLLHQRQQLVLHAATVSYRGQGLALCGVSGAGKSTLAAALCRAGCDFVGDDVAAIQFGADGAPTILPDGRQHRLWSDAIEQLALTDRLGPPVRPEFKKFHIDPLATAVQRPMPLVAIFILREAASPGQFDMALLQPADAASLVRGEVYRSLLAQRLGRSVSLFGQIASLLPWVRVFRLERPLDFAMLDRTVAAVLAQCGESV